MMYGKVSKVQVLLNLIEKDLKKHEDDRRKELEQQEKGTNKKTKRWAQVLQLSLSPHQWLIHPLTNNA